MNDEPNDGFLGRWSRRKVQARAGQPVPEPPPASTPQPVAADVSPAVHARSDAARTLAEPAPEAIKKQATALTLDDVKALTLDADFQPFVARGVAPEVRNAAFRKLFADPHFNVMDGLDIYIDDYSKPDPLSAGTLAQLASARFLKLVDEPEQEGAPAAVGAPPDVVVPQDSDVAAATPAQHDAAQQPVNPGQVSASADVAPSDPCNDLPIPPAEAGAQRSHDDADLRLQSHDAARPEEDRPGAG